MSQPLSLFLFYSFLFLFFSFNVDALYNFPVYRLLQYSEGENSFGSQRTSVNLLATTELSEQDLTRKILVLSWFDFNQKSFREALDKNVEGLLVILPNETSSLSSALLKEWHEFEVSLLRTQLNIPLYFTYEDPNLNSIFEDLQVLSSNSSESASSHSGGFWLNSDNFQLVVSQPEASPIKDITLSNFQGWLSGSSLNSEGDSPVTIGVVAHYDSFAIVPDLAYGADSNAGSSVAILELLRLFSKLYSGFRTQANYNILFLLTGGGKLGFGGSKHWLQKAETKLLDSLEFVVVLDQISTASDKLYFHVNRLSKDEKIQRLYNHFTNAAGRAGVEFEIVAKKTADTPASATPAPLSPPQWEHELFYRRKIASATLSTRATSSHGLFQDSDIFDTKSKVDLKSLERNIRIVGEALARHIYNLQQNEVSVFEGPADVSSEHISAWFETLASVPRMAPYLAQDSPILTGFQKAFEHYTQGTSRTERTNEEETDATSGSRFQVQTFKYEAEYQFYGGSKLTIAVYKVKPFLFEVMLSLCIISYLCCLYFFIKGPKEAWAQFNEFIDPKSDKKKR